MVYGGPYKWCGVISMLLHKEALGHMKETLVHLVLNMSLSAHKMELGHMLYMRIVELYYTFGGIRMHVAIEYGIRPYSSRG